MGQHSPFGRRKYIYRIAGPAHTDQQTFRARKTHSLTHTAERNVPAASAFHSETFRAISVDFDACVYTIKTKASSGEQQSLYYCRIESFDGRYCMRLGVKAPS